MEPNCKTLVLKKSTLNQLERSKIYFQYINELYDIGRCKICDDIVSVGGESSIDNLFSQQDKERIISSVFAGQVTPGKPDFATYQLIGDKLKEAIEIGMDISFASPDPTREILRLAEDLRENVFIFSGAKTHQEALEMSLNLFGPDGRPRTFKQFREIAGGIFDKFRDPWLKTEFITAERMSEGAAEWMEIQEEKDIFTHLQYQTIGDARVRPEHQVLNKISRPVDDPFWDTFFPPNGFRCRCATQKVTSKRETPLKNKKLPKLGPLFDFNVGKKRLIFAPEHPFFRVQNRFRPLARNNFGFPLPGRITK